MTNYIGRKIAVGIAPEAVRGTAETTPEYWLRILAQNHKEKADYLNSQGSIGSTVEFSHAEIDKQWAEGGFEAEIDADSIGLMLLALMGDVSSAVEGDGYLHTFELDEDSANHQSLTLFLNEPNRESAFPMACLNSLNFSFERGKILDFNANLMSLTGETKSSTPAFLEAKAFRPKDFHFYIADDIAGLATANEVYLRNFSLEFNKNLEADDVLGLENPKNFLNKVFSTTASLTALYQDDDYRDLFKAGTPKAIRVKLENPNNIIKDAVKAIGSYTVVDYSALAGSTVTVGGVVLTEGVDWDRGDSNNACATSLASAINALANVSAVTSTATVNITASVGGVAGNSITTVTGGGVNLTVSGANLTGGLDAELASLVFDFARVYFAEYDEGNGRDDLKTTEITLSFAVNTAEATIPFGQVRLLNEVASYI